MLPPAEPGSTTLHHRQFSGRAIGAMGVVDGGSGYERGGDSLAWHERSAKCRAEQSLVNA